MDTTLNTTPSVGQSPVAPVAATISAQLGAANDSPAGAPEVLGICVLLRYLLLIELERAGSEGCSIKHLESAVRRRGLELPGRPGKAVSDALRTELRLGRAARVRRGHYVLVRIPRTTRWRIRRTLHERELA